MILEPKNLSIHDLKQNMSRYKQLKQLSYESKKSTVWEASP